MKGRGPRKGKVQRGELDWGRLEGRRNESSVDTVMAKE